MSDIVAIRYPQVQSDYGVSVVVRPVENPIQVIYAPSNTGSPATNGVKLIFVSSPSPIPAGSTITIDGFSFVFLGVALFGNQLPATGYTVAQQGFFLYSKLLSNNTLTSLYDIVYTTAATSQFSITLRTRISGRPLASITGTVPFNLSTIVAAVPGSVSNSKEDWGIWLDLYIYTLYQTTNVGGLGSRGFPFVGAQKPNSALRAIIRLEKYQLDNETVTFDLAGALKGYVKPTPPVITTNGIVPVINQIMQFGWDAGQFYTDTNTGKVYLLEDSRGLQDGLYHYCTVGSLSVTESQVDIEEAWKNHWIRQTDGVNLLTNAPLLKPSSKKAKEYLYFYYARKGVEAFITAEYRFYFEDGSNVFYAEPLTQISIATQEGGCYRLDVSTVDFDAREVLQGVPIDWYEVRIVAHAITNIPNPNLPGNSYVTQVMSYQLPCEQDACNDSYAQLIFLNTRGGFDTVFCQGYTDIKTNRKAFGYEQTLNYNLQEMERKDSNIESFENRTMYGLEVGLLNRAAYQWLKELSSSGSTYLSLRGGEFFSVNITNVGWAADELQDTQTLRIECEAGYLDNYATNNT